MTKTGTTNPRHDLKGQRGSEHHKSKLSDADVRTIRRLYASGEWTYEMLAAKFDMSHPTIGKLIRGEIWKTVK